MPRTKGWKGGTSSEATSVAGANDEEMQVDAGWCDIAALPVDPCKYNLFHPPKAFYDGMLADSASWSHDADKNVARCVASAISKIVMPWLVDWQDWRKHASDFFRRLCLHRQRRADTTDARLEKLRTGLESLNARVVVLSASLGELRELAVTHPKTVVPNSPRARIRRAQLRAASRSPDPRVAHAAIREGARLDQESFMHANTLPRYEGEGDRTDAQILARVAPDPSASSSSQ